MQEAQQKQWAAAKVSGFSGGKSGKCKWKQRHDRWAKRASETKTKGTHCLHCRWSLFAFTSWARCVEEIDTSCWWGSMFHSLRPLSKLGPQSRAGGWKASNNMSRIQNHCWSIGKIFGSCRNNLVARLPTAFDEHSRGNITDNALATMGGNTMLVQIVAAAMVLAMCLVDWTKPDAARDFSDPETACQTTAISAAAKTQRKANASWKKTEQALLARFGLAQTRLLNKKGQKPRPASQKQWSCYDGMRWAVAKV